MRTTVCILVAVMAIVVTGCVQQPPMRSAVDTFCLTAKKRLWSIEDSPESIRQAVIWNKTVDRRCGIPGRD